MAGPLNGQRFDPHTLNRPAVHAQHSNSVPSTPYQRPRDLKFHSRSPSPHQGLANHAPHPTAPGAATQREVQRNPDRPCLFEKGEEIRKRRIPYVEGGNEELGPPKEEPKRVLEPDERDKLSGDMRELYDRILPSHESEERRAKLIIKLDHMLNKEWPNTGIRVHVFGSSGNLLSSTDSDVDICLATASKKLESMHSLALLLHKNGMVKVICRAAAKVPIVKCWDPELELAADLNVNNPLALHNTRMIKTYVQMDDRVRPLAKIIKYWTKQRILNDAAYGGTISSYTWICMIISFLQRREPPILPSLQKVEGCRTGPEADDQPSFADDVEAVKGFGDANKETLGDLLFHFFRHYGYEFEYSKYVVSIKEGRLLSREEKGWQPSNYHDKEARNRLCVEEPFTVNRNLGNSADDYAWSGIHAEMRRAFELLANGCQLDKCCEEYEFPIEDKPIFQKPIPKPKPTLTRSASQTGRPTHESTSQNRTSRKGSNRNNSAQRAGSRRASSGASFSNQRMPMPFSPNGGPSSIEYFAAKGNLHEQLFQQYQYLQVQADTLATMQRRLAHSATHAGGQQQARVGDVGGAGASPRHRPHPNGLPSPRYQDIPPQTAPLLPGYQYHYTPRFPPPSPMSQARSREGTSTNPSSPSLQAAVPALRRQIHRTSVTENSPVSVRSQSQPGRSLPHPLSLQQQVHPGYDISGGFAGFMPMPGGRGQPYFVNGNGHPVTFAPFQTMHAPPQPPPAEIAMPKEYVGYYVGSSPSLGPQYASASHMAPPPMTLRDPPPRQRRVTPDLMPPQMNGNHTSRSPSPLGHLRNLSNGGNSLSAQSQAQIVQSPISSEQSATTASTVPSTLNLGSPVIVNGSTFQQARQPMIVNGTSRPEQSPAPDSSYAAREEELARLRNLSLRTDFETNVSPEQVGTEAKDRPSCSPRVSPTNRGHPNPRLNLSPNGLSLNGNGVSDHGHHESPAPPLLSPVAEQPTPSPTRSRGFELGESPKLNGHFAKVAQVTNASQFDRLKENRSPVSTKHERKGSVPILGAMPSSARHATTPPQASGAVGEEPSRGSSQAAGEWQQATRKGHKKSKSSIAVKAASGQPMPSNEAERKGG